MFSTTEGVLWALTLLNLGAASCALWAAITARSNLRALRRKLAERATRSLRQLDAVVTEHESSLSKLSVTIRRLSSRTGMQDLRERRRAGSSTNLHEMTKSQLRLALASGQVRKLEHSAGLNGGEAPAETAAGTRDRGADADVD